jgi:hypothetical protein
VADDPTEDRTVVTVGGGGGASLAVIPFTADQFDGDSLTIPAESVPFAYDLPILQVTDSQRRHVLCGISVSEEPGGPITVTAQPYDGNLIILTTNT